LNSVTGFLSHFIEPSPQAALLVILNLIVIESLLSIDNASVLATLAMALPEKQRVLALRIGIVLAYIFRGLMLLFANLIMQINWLKLLGGTYLLYLCFDFFYTKFLVQNTGGQTYNAKEPRKLPGLNTFWSTVIMVEIMDLIFSIDNVFAAVAFTRNIYLVCTGVFIGIITMRIVAGYFVKLMGRLPFLNTVAFIVIGILGLRLCFDFCCTYFPDNVICHMLAHKGVDMYFSLLTATIFFLPIVSSFALGWPKKSQ